MVDPTLSAALQVDAPFLFGAIKIEFPGGQTMRLLDGSGELTMPNGEKYTGEHPVLGTLVSIDAIAETMDAEAPEVRATLSPADAVATASLTNSTVQGVPVTIMLGAFDPDTNLVIGVPEVVFYGEIDVPLIELGQGSREISYSIVSVFERLFELREGERAADGFHQSIWPGELGLEYVTGTVKNLYWGSKRTVPATVGRAQGFGAAFGQAEALMASYYS
jgi:hypothetical protein